MGKPKLQHNVQRLTKVFNLRLRFRQIAIFSLIMGETFFEGLTVLKALTVQRMFWGRGSWYKTSVHLLIGLITAGILLSGISTRIQSNPVSAQGLSSAYSDSANADLVAQGANLTSVVPLNKDQINFSVKDYTVRNGDSLDSIANTFKVSKDTIKWANRRILSPYNDAVPVGAQLKIPEMNGVLYEVGSNESLDSIVALTKGDRFTVIEINGLSGPNYTLTQGQYLFVPNGQLPPPPPQIIARQKCGGGYIPSGRNVTQTIGGLPAGAFDDPLSCPVCSNYGWNRGIQFYPNGDVKHTGVDLTKRGGCPIRAAAAGRVKYVGWLDGRAGWSVIIDHGNTVETHYYHGDGNIWVRQGDYVAKGQDIMYMGRSGVTTGVHLHLTLKYNGSLVDPEPYIPYRR